MPGRFPLVAVPLTNDPFCTEGFCNDADNGDGDGNITIDITSFQTLNQPSVLTWKFGALTLNQSAQLRCSDNSLVFPAQQTIGTPSSEFTVPSVVRWRFTGNANFTYVLNSVCFNPPVDSSVVKVYGIQVEYLNGSTQTFTYGSIREGEIKGPQGPLRYSTKTYLVDLEYVRANGVAVYP